MDRLACVDVISLPIQVLLRRHPEWAKSSPPTPVAVVDKDSPQGVVLFANEAARKSGVTQGQRYAAALSFCSELRAAAVAEAELRATIVEIERLLAPFTPGIETSTDRLGVFWLDARGMSLLEPSLEAWAERIVRTLQGAGFVTCVALGFSRFFTFVSVKARVRLGLIAFARPEDERAFVLRIPLARLDLPRELFRMREDLGRLGVRTLGEFAALPESGIRSRFGAEAVRLHRLANEHALDPLEPKPLLEPLERGHRFDFPIADLTALLFFLKPLLESLLAALAERSEALAEFSFTLTFERGEPHHATLKPAAPTLDIKLLLQLATLHLERMPQMCAGDAVPKERVARRSPAASPAGRRVVNGPNGIEEIALTAKGAPATREQLSLFDENPQRDLKAGNRALALVRSRFGDDAVRRIVLQDGHLPSASFRLEAFPTLTHAKATPALERPLIRRIFDSPLPLSPPRRHQHDDGWIVHDLKQGAVVKADGPYVVSGGWWREEVHREYRYVHTLSGDILWVYFDKKRRRWFLQGGVE